MKGQHTAQWLGANDKGKKGCVGKRTEADAAGDEVQEDVGGSTKRQHGSSVKRFADPADIEGDPMDLLMMLGLAAGGEETSSDADEGEGDVDEERGESEAAVSSGGVSEEGAGVRGVQETAQAPKGHPRTAPTAAAAQQSLASPPFKRRVQHIPLQWQQEKQQGHAQAGKQPSQQQQHKQPHKAAPAHLSPSPAPHTSPSLAAAAAAAGRAASISRQSRSAAGVSPTQHTQPNNTPPTAAPPHPSSHNKRQPTAAAAQPHGPPLKKHKAAAADGKGAGSSSTGGAAKAKGSNTATHAAASVRNPYVAACMRELGSGGAGRAQSGANLG